MSQKKQARHISNCQITAETAVITRSGKPSKVPSKKQKEDAKKVLYINRI